MKPDRSHLAVAKAKLTTHIFREAARAGLTARAQAVLGHLLAEAWPVKGRWIARLTHEQLAHRLTCHVGSIKRAVKEIPEHIIDRTPGNRHRVSRFVFCWGAPAHPRECAGATSRGAPAHPLPVQQHFEHQHLEINNALRRKALDQLERLRQREHAAT